jgi:hypothetical protein
MALSWGPRQRRFPAIRARRPCARRIKCHRGWQHQETSLITCRYVRVSEPQFHASDASLRATWRQGNNRAKSLLRPHPAAYSPRDHGRKIRQLLVACAYSFPWPSLRRAFASAVREPKCRTVPSHRSRPGRQGVHAQELHAQVLRRAAHPGRQHAVSGRSLAGDPHFGAVGESCR